MRIICRTNFDITATGVKSHFNTNRMPFRDDTGREIATTEAWHCSRNQQRNWETVNKIVALRTLPTEISLPQKIQQDDTRQWQFEFTVDTPSTIEMDGDPVGALLRDCQDVPMLTGLDEDAGIDACLVPNRNIYFEVLHDK